MSRINITSVSKKFGDTHAIADLTLDIADGEFMVLLGPSGCGKSTLLRMVAGLTQPSTGRIMLDRTDITSAPPRQRNLAMVFQSYALYPHLTVAKNIAFPLRTQKKSRKSIAESVSSVATMLGLTELLGRRPAELSGGQRQRVALARAMVREPGAFLMDEPLSNLDAKLRSATRSELIELHRKLGTTFLYVTHDQVEAMTMATRIALMNAGRIEQVGTPAELYDTPRSTFVAGFLGAPPMNLMDADVVHRGHELYAEATDFSAALGIANQSVVDRRAVIFGVRPERVRLRPNAIDCAESDGAAGITGTVATVEYLGGEELVHVAVGPNTLCAKVTSPSGVKAGDRVHLELDPSDIHLFDRDTRRRLVWQHDDEVTEFDQDLHVNANTPVFTA
ncbi:ABC transporter ATP-binding protein [Rhodococcus sp. BGS-1C]|uniref:ABC transporter ATP-binding protein n=1 Tax=Rhodococcus sp. KRD197 TaxID=2729731 RepID=UPI0019D1D658|nr:ABC transporter ATP-binding protein [Rhodococcus sp. KRD197]